MDHRSIQTNLLGILLFLVFAILPAYYTNRFLLRLIRPRESVWRMLAHIIIILAAAIVYTSLIVLVLVKYVMTPE